MKDIRLQINQTDDQIIKLLGKRMGLVKEIGILKKRSEIGIADEEREKEVMTRLKTLGKENGLSAEFVERLYEVVFEESRRIQNI